ncbi:hypothetical protein KKA33_02900 [Patescibacteria group bacterium]|nr:hypothetical protein [Patescibacteria group bacterium]
MAPSVKKFTEKEEGQINDFVEQCCLKESPAFDPLACRKLPDYLSLEAREKLGRVMIELMLRRAKARRPEDIPADIRPLVERIFEVKGYTPEDTDSHRRARHPDRIETEDDWGNI